ncbi:MAG: EamA/RhaT family transporter [Actinobacteria bacterium]|nr:MAG: EamA/RhaT family transporter [Actinomycetota bacterium]
MAEQTAVVPGGDGTTRPRAAAWLPAWLLLAVIWGSSFLLIKVGLHWLQPLQLAALRVVSGAATMLLVLLVTRQGLPRDRTAWLHASIVGILLSAIPFVLFAWAETRVTSVLAGLFNAATPLFTALAGLAIARGQRIGANRSLGLVIGVVGVGVILAVWQGLAGSTAGSLAAIGATVCYGIGIQWQQRFLSPRPEPAASLVAAQLTAGALLLVVLTAFSGERLPTQVDWQALGAVLALGVVGTGLAYLLFFRVQKVAGALSSSTITYATPVVSTLLGILVLGEPLTWNQPVGALLVLAGVALVQGFLRPLPERQPAGQS